MDKNNTALEIGVFNIYLFISYPGPFMLNYTSTDGRREATSKTRTFLTLLKPSSPHNLMFQQDNKCVIFSFQDLKLQTAPFKHNEIIIFSIDFVPIVPAVMIRYYLFKH